MYRQVVKFAGRKSEKGFSHRSSNQQLWDKMEDTAGLGIVLPTLVE